MPKAVAEIGAFFGPQVVSASVSVDGFSGFVVEIPPLPSVLAGFADPTQWQIPNSDVQTLSIPSDALPGTYTAVIKARHGIADRRTCFGCHQALSFAMDSLLDYRIHSIHTRSRRFPGNFAKCETCHLSPPTGPARGAFHE